MQEFRFNQLLYLKSLDIKVRFVNYNKGYYYLNVKRKDNLIELKTKERPVKL